MKIYKFLKSSICLLFVMALAIIAAEAASQAAPEPELAPELWGLAQRYGEIHRFSTLFVVQSVGRDLSSDAGIDEAIRWCKASGVTKVYLEEFRHGRQADRQTLVHARNRFRDAGIIVSGCITTTNIGKPSAGDWGSLMCYTDLATQDHVQSVFDFAASLFDEIMIDDFLATNCTCPDCDAARRKQLVTIGTKTYPVSSDSWVDYHCELMLRLSQDRILAPARQVNPDVQVINKYPNWYEEFHQRGYDVARQTAAYDLIWVGTETRDYTDRRWGGIIQYAGYFLMRWLGGIGGEKCGGGWYDTLGTTENTYIEQARQTILGGAHESMLFEYRGLQRGRGQADLALLRTNMPELFAVAREVRHREPIGIAAYKPPNSSPQEERCVFDYVGMMGLPLAPCHEFPTNAPVAFLSIDALADTNLVAELSAFIETGRPVLLTDGLVRRIQDKINVKATNVHVLTVGGKPDSLIEWPQARLDALRTPLLKALGATFQAPNRVALYLFTQEGRVVENFNDTPVEVVLNGQRMTVDARGWVCHWQ